MMRLRAVMKLKHKKDKQTRRLILRLSSMHSLPH